MRRLLTAGLTAALTLLAILAVSPAADARRATPPAAVRGTVLTLDRAARRAQVLDARGAVRTVRYRRATRGLRPGARVRAVRSARGTTLRTTGGSVPGVTLPGTVTGGGVRVGGVTLDVDLTGLAPGTRIVLSLRFTEDGVEVSVEIVPAAAEPAEEPGEDPGESGAGEAPAAAEDCEPTATFGTVAAINHEAGRLTLERPGGGRAVWAVTDAQLQGVAPGQDVVVASCDGVVTSVAAVTDAQRTVRGVVVRVQEDARQVILRQADGSLVAIDLPDALRCGFEVSDAVVVLVHDGAGGDLVADAVEAQESDDR